MILGEEPVTLQIVAETRADATGRTTFSVSSSSTILASVQPMNGDDLQTLPEGERSRQARKFYTTSPLSAGPPANRISVGGVVFELRHVEQQRSVIPHYKAIGVRLDEATS